jgi:hypothetical protein
MSTAAGAVNPVSQLSEKYSGMDYVNLLSALSKQVSWFLNICGLN